MDQTSTLTFEISRSGLSRLLQRVRLSGDDRVFDVWLAGEMLIVASTRDDVGAQSEAKIRIIQNPEGSSTRHWEVDADLFQRLLVSRTIQDLARDPIQIAIPLPSSEAAWKEVTAEIRIGDLRLTWPFREGGAAETLTVPNSQKTALIINGPIVADALMRCRPYAATKEQHLLSAIQIKAGFACGAQTRAARYIKAEELSDLDLALDRAHAGHVGYALRHFSASAKKSL